VHPQPPTPSSAGGQTSGPSHQAPSVPHQQAIVHGGHGHGPAPQYCHADAYEQSSQATDRDMERSEFSLQHQNSELDEEESLTFENLNNQSLSVIDEADGVSPVPAGLSSDTNQTGGGEPTQLRDSSSPQVYLERFDS